MRLISGFTAIILITLLVLSWFSNWNSVIWNFTQYFVPLLFLMTWIPFSFSFLYQERFHNKIEYLSIKRTSLIVLFGSFLVVLGTLLLNTRLFFTIMNTIINLFSIESESLLDQFVINELIVGILLPANEELMKIIPILVVLHSRIIFFSPESEPFGSQYEVANSIASRRQYAFYGIISGSIFTFLELFLYQWQTSAAETDIESVFFQIMLRTIAPVHVISTFFIALGIASFRIHSENLFGEETSKKVLLRSTFYVILGYLFHSTWNTINIFFAIFYPESSLFLYGLLLVIGILIDILLLICVITVFKPSPTICSFCGLEGENHKHHLTQRIQKTESERMRRFTELIKKVPILSRKNEKRMVKDFSCPFCYNFIVMGTCQHCGARTYVTCPRCHSFISETTTTCPSCKKKVNPLLNVQVNSFNLPETIILGVTSLASVAFLLAPLTILIFSQNFGENSVFIPILIFYFLMSLIALINVIVALFFDKTAGLLVLSCFFLELSLLVFLIIFGTLINGILTSILFSDIVGFILVTGGIMVGLFLASRYVRIFYKNYSPIFPELRINRDMEEMFE